MSKNIFYKVQMRGKELGFPSRYEIAKDALNYKINKHIRNHLITDMEVIASEVEGELLEWRGFVTK